MSGAKKTLSVAGRSVPGCNFGKTVAVPRTSTRRVACRPAAAVSGEHASEVLAHLYTNAHNRFISPASGKEETPKQFKSPWTGYGWINADIFTQRNITYSVENERRILELHGKHA